MREILFRGKTDKGEWVYGAYCHLDWVDDDESKGIGEKPSIIDYNNDCLWTYVIPDTLGQYTGLTDKNGTKIFEGDIVKVDYIGVNKGVSGVAEVVFNDCKFALVWGWHKEIVCLTDFANVCFEVIGTIHDNPELLESEVQGE